VKIRLYPESADKDDQQTEEQQNADANDPSDPEPASSPGVKKYKILAAHKRTQRLEAFRNRMERSFSIPKSIE